MQNTIQEFLKKLESYPELLDINDLINLGLYSNKNDTYRARRDGNSPHYIKMPGKILYPKEAVKEFILSRLHDGQVSAIVKTKDEHSV
jgi:hypothetical protein